MAELQPYVLGLSAYCFQFAYWSRSCAVGLIRLRTRAVDITHCGDVPSHRPHLYSKANGQPAISITSTRQSQVSARQYVSFIPQVDLLNLLLEDSQITYLMVSGKTVQCGGKRDDARRVNPGSENRAVALVLLCASFCW